MCGESGWIGDDKDMTSEGLEWDAWDDWSGTDPGKSSSTLYNLECSTVSKGMCHKWRPIDWRPSNSLITCIKEDN
jgi:hypothetical protein